MLEKYDTMAEDRETVINFCEHNIGEWAEVYTTDKVVMRRFEKFCKEHPEYGKLLSEDKYSMTFSVHPKSASLYPFAPRKTVMTEEKLERLRTMAATARAAKQN